MMKGLRLFATLLLLLCVPPAMRAASPADTASKAYEAFEAGEAEQALALYRRTLSEGAARDEHRAILHYDIGTCLIALGRFGEARDELILCLGIQAEAVHPNALYNLGHAFEGLGDVENAMKALRQCMLLRPSHREAKLLYEWLLRSAPPVEEPPPDEPPPEGQSPRPPPPNILEKLPQPPPKELQEQVRPPQDAPAPGQKPW